MVPPALDKHMWFRLQYAIRELLALTKSTKDRDRERIVALLHGHGELELGVPILRELAPDYEIILDASSCEEGKARAAIGHNCKSLREEREQGEENADKKLQLKCAIKKWNPIAVITGLHSNQQWHIAKWLRERKTPCFGLLELCPPSDRHRNDKPKSKIQETLCLVSHVLSPTPLREVLQTWLQQTWLKKKCAPTANPPKILEYGLPEPWNQWVDCDNGTISLKDLADDPFNATPERICFVGQHHSGNATLLAKVAESVEEPALFLRHPKDKQCTPPGGWQEIGPGDERRSAAVKHSTVFVTEYSNLGYSLALAGRPVVYAYEDPEGDEPMQHLAVILGNAGKLPVTRWRRENGEDLQTVIRRAQSMRVSLPSVRTDVKGIREELRSLAGRLPRDTGSRRPTR